MDIESKPCANEVSAQRPRIGPRVQISLILGERLHLVLSTSSSDGKDLRQGVSAEVSWNAREIYGEYVHSDWHGFDLGTGLVFGQSQATLWLSDGDDALEFSSRASSLGPYLFAGWTSTVGVALRLSARYVTEAHDFGYPGKLDARRTETGLGFLYRFGGLARRR
jgi:hypothetical protein